MPTEDLSKRTKKLVRELVGRLTREGIAEETAAETVSALMKALGLTIKNGKTEYLLMVGEREIQALAALCLEAVAGGVKDKELGKRALAALDGGDAVDLALFGRMVADLADKNVNASVQMAHAFSTNAVANEFDYYTAVDDLQSTEDDEGAGAAMLGTILYNSSCYYRYANVDVNQLASNLQGDYDKALAAVDAFLEGMVKAVPSGKQSNTAAQNPPSLILVTVREHGLWSLANAFVTPVWTKREDLVAESADRLLQHWKQLISLYGGEGIRYAGMSTYLPIGVETADISHEENFSQLKQQVHQALQLEQN